MRSRLLALLLVLAAAVASAATDPNEQMKQLNADTSTPVLQAGAKGAAVVRAQVLLDRAWFSPGEIDGHFGTTMQHAVAAFQLSRNMRDTGVIDAATWQALASEAQAPVYGTYALTEQDLAGPYMPLPKDVASRAQLPRLGYESLEEAVAERFHMSPKLLRQLNEGRAPQAGQLVVVVDTNTQRAAPKASTVRIDKSDKMLYLLGAQQEVLAAFPVSFGSEEKDPLPLGALKIISSVKDPYFDYDPALIRTSKPTDTKARLQPGPNNPVGVYWLGLNKPHIGIHGTAEPSQMGRVTTSGCVRLTNWDVQRLASVAKPNTVVEVQS